MTDLKLLQHAALAAGLEYQTTEGMGRLIVRGADRLPRPWDPINDDGDALRLANRLRISITMYNEGVTTRHFSRVTRTLGSELGREDAATRRAIVTAAAAMWLDHVDEMDKDEIVSVSISNHGNGYAEVTATTRAGTVIDVAREG